MRDRAGEGKAAPLSCGPHKVHKGATFAFSLCLGTGTLPQAKKPTQGRIRGNTVFFFGVIIGK